MNYEAGKNWVASPLNRTGDLDGWKQKMKNTCPNPKLGQVVWINRDRSSIGYKVISFSRYGDPIWQRGEVVYH